MLRRIHDQDTKGILDLIDQMMREGRELSQFVTDFLWYLRNLLLIKTGSGSEDTLDMSMENRRLLEEEATFMEEEVIMRFIRVLSELLNQMRFSTQKRVLMDVGFLKLAKPQMETDTASLLQRIIQLEEKMEKGVFVTQPEAGKIAQESSISVTDTGEEELGPEDIDKRYEPATAQEVKKIASNWRNITTTLSVPMKMNLSRAKVHAREDGKGIRLLFPQDDLMAKEYFDRESHREDLQEAIASMTGKVLEIETGQLTKEEAPKEKYLDLSKIKMPITYE